uniref:PKcGMP_CC domain-containing protein n=1 Tax=Gongylonema pulchrum TaxID=637853 RepID=A0A183CVV5_9BILA
LVDQNDLTQTEELDRIADEEVQGMLRRSEQIRRRLLEERNMQASKEIDESIAMLLEYADDLDMLPNRESHYPISNGAPLKPIKGVRSDGPKTASHGSISCGASRNKSQPVKNQNGNFFENFYVDVLFKQYGSQLLEQIHLHAMNHAMNCS